MAARPRGSFRIPAFSTSTKVQTVALAFRIRFRSGFAPCPDPDRIPMRCKPLLPIALAFALAACQVKAPAPEYDVIIRHGTVYDGTGNQPVQADIGIRGQRIATVGDLAKAHAAQEVDARGFAVAPGF